jgi:DNA-binding protein HU-beta
MNIAELADHVATTGNLSKAQAKQIVDALFSAIVADAAKGGETSIPGFGKFKVASRPEREGRNPATGETIKIAASKKLGFTPAKAVKDALNG